MKTQYTCLVLCLMACTSLFYNCAPKLKQSAIQPSKEFADAPNDLKINQIQVLGTHNSYEQPVDKNVLAYVTKALQPMMEKMFDNMSPERKAEYLRHRLHRENAEWQNSALQPG
jgi:hypothetical protein